MKVFIDPARCRGPALFLGRAPEAFEFLDLEDVRFHGQELSKGDKAILMFPAAGLDPAAFGDVDEIDFQRTGNRHMAFGLGPHRGLGSHHGRMMFKVMLGEILRRLPDFRISGPTVRFNDAGDVYAFRSLPIEFTPGSKEGHS